MDKKILIVEMGKEALDTAALAAIEKEYGAVEIITPEQALERAKHTIESEIKFPIIPTLYAKDRYYGAPRNRKERRQQNRKKKK